jgi:hypothetical protein
VRGGDQIWPAQRPRARRRAQVQFSGEIFEQIVLVDVRKAGKDPNVNVPELGAQSESHAFTSFLTTDNVQGGRIAADGLADANKAPPT